jgi:hypothetical protein
MIIETITEKMYAEMRVLGDQPHVGEGQYSVFSVQRRRKSPW